MDGEAWATIAPAPFDPRRALESTLPWRAGSGGRDIFWMDVLFLRSADHSSALSSVRAIWMNLARPPIGKAVALVEANCGGFFINAYIQSRIRKFTSGSNILRCVW